MNNLSIAEKRALELMKKENFRGISKDNVVHLVSVLDKVDPAVAKELIQQMPEFFRGEAENVKAYAEVLKKGIDSCASIKDSCFQTQDEIIKSLQKEIEKEDTTFEQKQYYFDKMSDAAVRKEQKDTEHNNMVLTYLKIGGEVIGAGLLIMAGIYLGKADLHIPFKKAA